MSRLDLDQIDRDELAERRLERDRQREPPAPFRRALRVLEGRHEAQIRRMDPTASESVPCPVCRSPVYAPADSNHEQVDCFSCDARLVTRQGIGGLEVVL